MGAPEKLATSNNNSMQRVKVYRLNGDGKWDDQGTGHVTIDYLERSEDLSLCVIDEEDNETLLVHRICSDDIYRKQEDTIISWRDSEYSSELALSFQETKGCSYIWDHICNVQRNLHFNTIRNETYNRTNSELRELPPVELSTLPKILKVVVNSSVTDQLCVTELILHDQSFFPNLMDLFCVCEDFENKEGLHMIYKIVKGIILLNSPRIFEKVFSDELIMDIIGCLEYDLETPHVNHRNILKEQVVFNEAVPIKDPLILSKLHQTYRIGYLKDVVLPRVLDEATVASLNSMIHSNNGMVVTLLKDDITFIKEEFARLKSPTTPPDSKRNLEQAFTAFVARMDGELRHMRQAAGAITGLLEDGVAKRRRLDDLTAELEVMHKLHMETLGTVRDLRREVIQVKAQAAAERDRADTLEARVAAAEAMVEEAMAQAAPVAESDDSSGSDPSADRQTDSTVSSARSII